MKIIQNILLKNQLLDVTSNTFEVKELNYRLDPLNYTDISGLYFQATIENHNAGSTTTIQLYDFDTNDVIATLTNTNASATLTTSADFSSAMGVSVRNLGIKAKVDPVPAFGEATVYGLKIIVKHETTETSRETLLDYIINETRSTTNAVFSQINLQGIAMEYDFINGSYTMKLSSFMKTASGGTAEADLYDRTTSQSVSGSVINTTSTTFAYLESGNLTLIQDHDYVFRLRNQTSGKQATTSGAHIQIIQTGFTQALALCSSGTGTDYEEVSGAQINKDLIQLDLDNVSASDSVEYTVKTRILNTTADNPNPGIWIYDITSADIIEVTEHIVATAENTIYEYNDLTTFDGNSDVLQMRGQTNYGFVTSCVFILSFLTEDYPAGFTSFPDITQPSGYHCFMKQFIKNSIAGNIPMLTPESANKCW